MIPITSKNINPINGIQISEDDNISKNVGALELLSIILLMPEPNDAQINICGNIPKRDPKKKFLTLILKIVGKILEIKKGIPPTNLYIKKKLNSFFLNLLFKLENLFENFSKIKSFKK